MRKLKGFMVITGNFIEGYFSALRGACTNKNVFWTFNQTFFYGENAKENRDKFQKEFKELVAKYR